MAAVVLAEAPQTYAAIGARADAEIQALKGDLTEALDDLREAAARNEDLADDVSDRDARIAQLQELLAGMATPAPEYGPVSIQSLSELDLPSQFNYVTWRFGNLPLQDVFRQLGANDVLVLPERPEPYLIDTSKGFRQGDGIHDVAMTRCKAGIVGMGPGAVIKLGPSGFSQGRTGGTAGNRNKVLECWTAGAVIMNFTMIGRDLGGCAFDAIKGAAPDIRMERLRLVGAHRGWSATPPGEAGGLVNHKAPRMIIRRCEVDCRDAVTGLPVGPSPIMLNVSDGCLIEDTYVHHANLGAPTAWNLANLTTRRLRSEFNSTGFNHELVRGTVTHEDATFIIDRSGRTANRGSHISIGTNQASAVYKITMREWDAGYESAPASFFVQHMTTTYTPYGQRDADIQVLQAARPKPRPVPVLFGR